MRQAAWSSRFLQPRPRREEEAIYLLTLLILRRLLVKVWLWLGEQERL